MRLLYIVSKHITPHNITLPSHHIIKIHQNETRRDSVHWRRALLGALRVRANQPATAQYLSFICYILLLFSASFLKDSLRPFDGYNPTLTDPKI